eukprot:jgi/Ulvmu1/5694/UM024_0041.1
MQHLQACFTVALPVCIICTVLRVFVNVVAERVLPKPASSEEHKKRLSLLEESWLLVSSTVLLSLSTWVSEYHNDGCSLLSYSGCFDGWPLQTHTTPLTAALAVFLGWYSHCVLKSLVPGIGLHAGLDMVGHHFLTLLLLAFGHIFHVQRMGFLILSLLNFSSPFMHAAKIMHYSGARKPVKAGTFILFTAAFALSRCLLFPRMLLYIVATVRERLGNGETEVILPSVITLSGLSLLQVLQYYWMLRIVRVIMAGGMESKDKRAAAAAAGPDADGTATSEPGIDAPARAGHISPATSPDGTPLPPPVRLTPAADAAEPAGVLSELSENVLDSPLGVSASSRAAFRRPRPANGFSSDDAAPSDHYKAA